MIYHKLALVALLPVLSSAINVGDKVPSAQVWTGFPANGGELVDIRDRVAGKKTILVGLPGAFTPT